MSRDVLIGVVGALVLGVVGTGYLRSHRASGVGSNGAEVKTAELPLLADATLDKAAKQLAELKSGITVSNWQSLHPTDKRDDETWASACVLFQFSEVLTDGNRLTRTAAFYPPEPTKPLEMPTRENPATLIDSCVLGMIRVEVAVGDRDKLLRSVPRIQAAFRARFGDSQPELATPHGLTLGEPWKMGEATVLIERNPEVNPSFVARANSHAQWQTNPRLIARSFLPQAREEDQPNARNPYPAVTPETSPEVFSLAMQIAAVEQPELVRSMNMLYQDCYQRPSATDQDGADREQHTTAGLARGKKVVEALRQWQLAARDLPAQRKAAALLAAYFLLKDATDHLEQAELEAMRQWLLDANVIASGKELTETGATANWAKQGRDLDPDGPIGQAVTLMSITAPRNAPDFVPEEYRPMGTLEDGSKVPAEVAGVEGQKDVTDFVIEAGQKYLSKTHAEDMTERVEYAIASAYCDRIQVVKMDDDPDSIAKFEWDRAQDARPEALKYFSMVIRHHSPLGEAAWRDAWRVTAGLPVMVRYYEVGD